MALFGKKRNDVPMETLAGILDAQDADMLVVRGPECRLLFMNASARARMTGVAAVFTGQSCHDGYCKRLPEMCGACPLAGGAAPPHHPAEFVAEDVDGKAFSTCVTTVQWVDGKPAAALYLRDVSHQQALQRKLYTLAYIDHLTQIPNRQRLKEDYDAIAQAVASGHTGLLAIFDMDNFKAINDTYGHNTGDVMLRRLVDHLQADQNYKGHLYRLGGDEFVFLFKDKPGRFSDETARLRHYEALLKGAFLAYSMPNIELSCTISMGAAFFPEHGAILSELLRKADIALYQAKDNGRNRLVFFEDRYDTAKKFKDLYINIQPILTGHGRTYGYELVDRDNESDGEDALNLADFDRTLDSLSLGDMDSDARYFIHYSGQLLSKTVLRNLPKDKFVVQIALPPGQPPSPALLKKYGELKKAGYQLALAGVSGDNTTTELMRLATYVKFADGMAAAPAQKQLMAAYPDKWFVATGVDTNQAFEVARAQGFKLFEGFFFNQPTEVHKTKEVDPMRVNYLRLLRLTGIDGYVDFKEIAAVISSDVALSYKLLRLLNSAAVGLRNPVSSIDMALAYLGEDNLKKWTALLALRGIASDKPLELVRLSLIRARFGELLSEQMQPRRDARHIFMLGLFSLVHIALEKTRAELFEEIPVAEDIKLSLLTDDGPYSDIAAFFSNYEYANWDEVTEFSRANGLSDRVVSDAYIASVKWYNDLAGD